jgi:tetratricopeptide (TPR) repeat protein
MTTATTIKGMITMKTQKLFAISGTCVALALAGCATGGGTKSAKEPLPDEVDGKGGAAVTERETISKAGAEQIIPKEKKRNITADQRADFEKAMKRYQEARGDGTISRSECSSVSDAFKRVADDNPGLLEARFNQGAVLYECGRDDEAARIWEGMKYGPAITNLGYIAWKNNEHGRAESQFKKAIDDDPLHSVEARNNIAQILRDKARKASSSEEKKSYVSQAVSNLRTVLALDSNNLQAFSTLAFIYYDMNMLEMAKLVGNQAIKKAEEIATGKFEEEKVEEAQEKSSVKAGKGKKGGKDKDKGEKGEGEESAKPKEIAREAGTGVTSDMKRQLAVVHNTLGLVELKKKNISPAIKQFKEASTLNPNFAEARMNLAALSLNNRDYVTAEENFRAVLKLQPKNFEASIGLGVALRGNKKIDEAEQQYNAAKGLDPSQGASYFNLGLLYQEYKDGQKPSLQKAQDYYRQFLGHASGNSQSLVKEAEKRIKDIDEIYVALEEAAKMQREAEEMQRKAEEQQKKMEEEMKKMEELEKKQKAEADAKAAADAQAKAAPGGDKGAAPAAAGGPAAGAEGAKGDDAAAGDKPAGGKKGGKKKK